MIGPIYHIDLYSHKAFLTEGLNQLLPDGSFASRLWRAIGNELHSRLDELFGDEVEWSSIDPVESLFLWVSVDGGLDPQWLAGEDGRYLDDEGEEISPTISPTYSNVEQLAAFGLWFLSAEFNSLGAPSKKGRNERGWSRKQVLDHQIVCLLFAYQALSYSQRIMLGTQLSVDESEKAAKLNFSAMGKRGATKRHAPMAALRVWAITRYREGKWASANQAAHDMQREVIEYGRTIGAVLSEANAQRTIADWFRRKV